MADVIIPTTRPARVTSDGKSQPLIGNECHLYVEEVANWDTPALDSTDLVDEAMDVNISDWSLAEVEVVTRASDWAVNLVGKFRLALEFQYLYGANWTMWEELQTLWMNRTPAIWWVADMAADTVNAQGLRFPGYIVQFPTSQGVEDAVVHDTIRVVPAYALNTGDVRIHPVWFVDGGIPPAGDFNFTPFQEQKAEQGKMQLFAVDPATGKKRIYQGQELLDLVKASRGKATPPPTPPKK